MEKIANYINGALVPPGSNHYLDNYNPAKGEVYSLIPDSDEKDVEDAVAAAKSAFAAWSELPIDKRSAILLKIASLIETHHEELALAECIDNGKPLKLAKTVDIPRAAANFRFYGSIITGFGSESHMTDVTAINYTVRKPVGIAGCISPWNLPLYLFTWKIAPALAAGNCVVAKPSEITPMTAYLLSKICIDAGLPKGVLNIVHGLGSKAGEAIIAHPEIPAISFTGGTVTGKKIATIAGPMFKKLSLELGGKNPNIIFEDCDFDKALSTSIQSSFSNQGQICLCGSRILVHESIYERFKDSFLEKTRNLVIGDPLVDGTQIGALVSDNHLKKVLSYVALAQQEGGTVLTGGKQVHLNKGLENGYFMEPAVIEGLDYRCRTNQEEIFGPVVTLTPFKSEEEAILYANSTEYGLSATIWTERLNRAHRVSERLKSGIIWVNCWMVRDLRTPFGGMKQSGVGREGGVEALRFFTEVKNVCVKI